MRSFVRRYLNGADANRPPHNRRAREASRSLAWPAIPSYDAFGEPAQPAIYFSYRMSHGTRARFT